MCGQKGAKFGPRSHWMTSSSEQHRQLCALLLSFLDGVTVPDAKRSLRNRREERRRRDANGMIPDIKLLFKMLLTVAPPNSGNRSQVYNPKGLLFFYELRRAYIKHRCATSRRAFLCEVARAPPGWAGKPQRDLEVTEAAATATVSWDRDTVWDLFWKLSS